jgi:O-antigen ligase
MNIFQDRRYGIALLSLAAIIILVPFFQGTSELLGLLILSILNIPLLFFGLAERDIVPSLPTKFVLFFLLAVAAIIAGGLFTPNYYQAGLGVVWWLNIAMATIATLLLTHDQLTIRTASIAAIIGGVLGAIVGYYYYFTTVRSYLRFYGILYDHNAYGGFILLSMSLALVGFLFTRTKKGLWFYGISTLIIFPSFVLTFSRGSWLSFILAALIVIALYFKSFKTLPRKQSLVRLGIIVLGIVIIFLVSLKIQTTILAKQGYTADFFQQESSSENGVSFRLHYYLDGLKTFAKSFPFGVGLNNYKEGVLRYKTERAFYASDPHNIYIRAVAELGVFGLLFIGFFIYVAWKIISRSRHTEANKYGVGLSLALLAMIFHGGLEIDWSYPSYFLFFCLFSALFIISTQKNKYINTSRLLWLLPIVAVLLLALSYVGYQSDNLMQDGDFYLSKNYLPDAKNQYDAAIHLNPYNSDAYLSRAGYFISEANTGNATTSLMSALSDVEKALNLDRRNSQKYTLLAVLNHYLHQDKNEEQALLQAIAEAPYGSLLQYNELIDLYLRHGLYQAVIDNSLKILPPYEQYVATSFSAGDPDLPSILTTISNIYKNLSVAYIKLGKIPESKQAVAQADLYQKKHIQMVNSLHR